MLAAYYGAYALCLLPIAGFALASIFHLMRYAYNTRETRKRDKPNRYMQAKLAASLTHHRSCCCRYCR